MGDNVDESRSELRLRSGKGMNKYAIYYISRHNPFEGVKRKRMYAPSKRFICDNWISIMHTDEYVIVRVDEVTK